MQSAFIATIVYSSLLYVPYYKVHFLTVIDSCVEVDDITIWQTESSTD